MGLLDDVFNKVMGNQPEQPAAAQGVDAQEFAAKVAEATLAKARAEGWTPPRAGTTGTADPAANPGTETATTPTPASVALKDIDVTTPAGQKVFEEYLANLPADAIQFDMSTGGATNG